MVSLSRIGWFQEYVVERRDDFASGNWISRQINLAMSVRGWKDPETLGVSEEIGKIAIPVYGRTMHDVDGNPFGANEYWQAFATQSDLVFATDGAFSPVRYHAMQKLDQFQYNQHYIEDGYREIPTGKNADGKEILPVNVIGVLHRSRLEQSLFVL